MNGGGETIVLKFSPENTKPVMIYKTEDIIVFP